MVFSKVGPNQNIEWDQIKVSKSRSHENGFLGDFKVVFQPIPGFWKALVYASRGTILRASKARGKMLQEECYKRL